MGLVPTRPSRIALVVTLVLLIIQPQLSTALDNGLAQTPAMGYNTWNAFWCGINETLVKNLVDKFVEYELPQYGYRYFNLDDCWHNKSRSSEGQLQADSSRFPSDMRALGDYIHDKGLKFGIYSDAGLFTCAGYPGSLGHEGDDAAKFASWGVDYLKYDNCYSVPGNVKERYTAMRNALNATGRPIVFSMCEWGLANPWQWAKPVGNSWRTTDDIDASWPGVMMCLDGSVGISKYAGPGGWNDPDMLEVGNKQLSFEEEKAHFALWALLKAPLLIGADLRQIPATSLTILKAKEVIAVNQDPLGVAGDLIWHEGNQQVYAGPLQGGARAVVLLNRLHSGMANDVTVTWEQLGLEPTQTAVVRDLYAERDIGTFSGSYTAGVLPHSVAALKVTPVDPTAHPQLHSWRPWHGNARAVAAVKAQLRRDAQVMHRHRAAGGGRIGGKLGRGQDAGHLKGVAFKGAGARQRIGNLA